MNKSNIQLDILLDMDEVVNNLTHHWVKTLNSIHRLSVDFEKISEWDMKKAYPTLTPEHIYSPLYIEDFWNGVKLLPGAKEGINELLSMGHRVFILTSSYPQNVEIKAKWLSKNLPEIPWKNIIIADDTLIIFVPHWYSNRTVIPPHFSGITLAILSSQFLLDFPL